MIFSTFELLNNFCFSKRSDVSFNSFSQKTLVVVLGDRNLSITVKLHKNRNFWKEAKLHFSQ